MSFQCFMDNCDWECAENSEHIKLSEHFINNHESIRIVELLPDNLQINCNKMGEQEKELINVPYVIQYGGYNFLLCVSWGARFECWIYKLDDKPFVEDGKKLELTLTLNSVKENTSDKEYDTAKELIFLITTRPFEIISAQSGLSISGKAMEKNFIKTESSNPESSFITITIDFDYTIIEEEDKSEIEEVLENKEDEVAQPALLVLKTQEIFEEPSELAHLASVCVDGKRKGEFKCPKCLTPLSVKMLLQSLILPDSPESQFTFEGESRSAASTTVIMQPETQLSCDNPQSVKTVLESSLGNSDPILPDPPHSSLGGESSSAITAIANMQPEKQLSCDNPKKHQSRDEETFSKTWKGFTNDDRIILNILRSYPMVFENVEEKVPCYRLAKEEDKPMIKDLILIYAGYKPSNTDSENDEK